jgi:hypothetical protein
VQLLLRRHVCLYKVRRGVMAEESAELLRQFFRWRRSQPGYCDEGLTVQPSESASTVASCAVNVS